MLFQQVTVSFWEIPLDKRTYWQDSPIPLHKPAGICLNQLRPSVFNDALSHLLGRGLVLPPLSITATDSVREVPSGVHIVYRRSWPYLPRPDGAGRINGHLPARTFLREPIRNFPHGVRHFYKSVSTSLAPSSPHSLIRACISSHAVDEL